MFPFSGQMKDAIYKGFDVVTQILRFLRHFMCTNVKKCLYLLQIHSALKFLLEIHVFPISTLNHVFYTCTKYRCMCCTEILIQCSSHDLKGKHFCPLKLAPAYKGKHQQQIVLKTIASTFCV